MNSSAHTDADADEKLLRLKHLLHAFAGADGTEVFLPAPGGRMRVFFYWSQLWFVLALHTFSLRVMSLNRFLHFMQKIQPAHHWSLARLIYTIGRIDAMLGCRHGHSNNRCLLRASLQFWSLAQAGFKPAFNIGLRIRANAMGHAWTSLDGQALFDPEGLLNRFPVFLHRERSVSYWLEVSVRETGDGQRGDERPSKMPGQ
jgi:hypothetical protein